MEADLSVGLCLLLLSGLLSPLASARGREHPSREHTLIKAPPGFELRDSGARPPHPAARAAPEPPSAPNWAGQPDWDLLHYDIDLHLDFEGQQILGAERLRVRARRDDPGPLLLHATEPTITSIALDGAALPSTRSSDSVEIELPAGISQDEELELSLQWTAPGSTDGGWGFQWGAAAFSSNEPYGARTWLVVYDEPGDKASVTWTVTAPSTRVVVTNGLLLSATDNGDGTTTWLRDFDGPLASYLFVVQAADYAVTEDNSGAVPVFLYASPAEMDEAEASLADTPAMIEHFSELWFDYPWTHYSNVLVPGEGAMENTTATSFGADWVGEPFAPSVNAHELAHHWWGDLVTCADWDEIWLNEGFASYSEALWAEELGREEHRGEEALLDYVSQQRASYLARRAAEPGSSLYAPLFLFGTTVYDKGALVLHMLRRLLGDNVFFAGMRAYGLEHQGDVVTTIDLQASMESAADIDLDWFFEQWVYRPGDPSYLYALTLTPRGEQQQLDVHILQSGDPTWTMPLPTALHLADGSTETVTVWAEGAASVTSFCLDKPLAGSPGEAVVVDPHEETLFLSILGSDEQFPPESDPCGDSATSLTGEWTGGGCNQGPGSKGGISIAYLCALGALLRGQKWRADEDLRRRRGTAGV